MGRVLLVCGSRGMAGAAVLASEAALRAGAGYAVTAIPGSISPELTAALPSAVLHLCGDSGRECLGRQDLSELLEEAARAQALAIGPGLGGEAGTGELVAALFSALAERQAELPVVADADALNLMAARRAAARGEPARWPLRCVITPHPGEAARLLGLAGGAAEVQADRPAALRALVSTLGVTVLLKGAGTLVGCPEEPEPWVNRSGNAGMAKAGSGDVLTGVLAALLARGLSCWDAARLGAHLHGRAGDLAAAELGQESILASDLIRLLPAALKEHPRAPAC